MWQKVFWDWNGRPTLIGFSLPFATPVHYLVGKVQPSTGGVDAPTKLKNGFMPCSGVESNEDEASNVIGRFEHPTPLHRLARADIKSNGNDAKRTSQQAGGLRSRQPPLSCRSLGRESDRNREKKLFLLVGKIQCGRKRFQLAPRCPGCNRPFTDVTRNTRRDVGPTRRTINKFAHLFTEVGEQIRHMPTYKFRVCKFCTTLLTIEGEDIRYRDLGRCAFSPFRPMF